MELTNLKGIGPKTEELFGKMGIKTAEELLEFFPRDYETFSEPITVSEAAFRTSATFRGAFTQIPAERRTSKVKITTSVFKDETGQPIKAVWFNSPFIKNTLKTDCIYVIRGKLSRKFGITQIEQPKIYTEEQYALKLKEMQPVYPLTAGLANATIVKAVKDALESTSFENVCKNDPVPKEISEELGLEDRGTAIKNLHFPESREKLQKAASRMAFEEIFMFIYMMKKQGSQKSEDCGIKIPEDERTKNFIENLPFRLTNAQLKVLSEISADMSGGKVMNRLVQGDVGSGKTMVALCALMNTAYAGYQGVLMAPTEVLAAQHYENINKIFRENNIKLNAALLTGSMTALEKKVVYDALEDGRVDIAIGTHALIQDKVKFKNLALAITDEQHRFGIKQRKALADKASGGGKSITPHMIVMSATPIPRTLALIVYGGMDVSVIDELPAARKKIKNALIDDSLKDNAYRLILREIQKGRQAYIICPLVEFSEGLDACNVTDYVKMLEDVFEPPVTVGMLHGQMPPAKKNEIMKKFADGKIDILVSTTVVEVGVDVPNATVMMIEDADRFGLAALHQLRGRVGRGDAQSYCIFVSNNKSKESKERLEVLNHSNDGFEIAAKDLKLRGPGESTGIRQSGLLSFKNFDIYRDADIAQQALQAVSEVEAKNIKMPEVNIEESLIL